MSDYNICADWISNFKGFVSDLFSCGPRTYKRLLFTLFISVFLPLWVDELNNGLYYSIAFAVCAWIFLINFPVIVKSFHSRPTYYDDLEDDRYEDHYSRTQHQSIFVVTHQIVISVIVFILVFYYQYNYSKSNLSPFEAAGVLWSIAGMLYAGYNYIAKIVKGGVVLMKKHNSRKIHVGKNTVRRLTFSLSDLDFRPPTQVDLEMKELQKMDSIL